MENVVTGHRAVMKEINSYWRYAATIKKPAIKKVLADMKLRGNAARAIGETVPTKWDRKRHLKCMVELHHATTGIYWLLDEMVVDWDTYLQPCLLQPFCAWKWRDGKDPAKPRQWTYVVWGDNSVADWTFLKSQILAAKKEGKKLHFV